VVYTEQHLTYGTYICSEKPCTVSQRAYFFCSHTAELTRKANKNRTNRIRLLACPIASQKSSVPLSQNNHTSCLATDA